MGDKTIKMDYGSIYASIEPEGQKKEVLNYSVGTATATIVRDVSTHLLTEEKPVLKSPTAEEERLERVITETIEMMKRYWWQGFEIDLKFPGVGRIKWGTEPPKTIKTTKIVEKKTKK